MDTHNGLHDFYPNPFLMIMINASYNNHYTGHIKLDKENIFFFTLENANLAQNNVTVVKTTKNILTSFLKVILLSAMNIL